MEICLIALACLLALAVAASIRAGYLAGRRSRIDAGRQGEERVGELLDLAGGHDRLDGVVFEASSRKAAQVDHLVRGACCLIVVETKNWNGLLDGTAEDEHWTLRRRSGDIVSMRNPLRQAARQAGIVREAAKPDTPTVRHLVVMAGRARHAQGSFPNGVVTSRELRTVLPAMLAEGGDPVALEHAWSRLVEQAFSPEADRRANRYVARLEERFGDKPWRSWLIVALALAALTWTMALCLTALGLRGDGMFM